jgi:hypothetical protein
MSLHICAFWVSLHTHFPLSSTWPVGWDDLTTAISFAGLHYLLPSVNRIHGNLIAAGGFALEQAFGKEHHNCSVFYMDCWYHSRFGHLGCFSWWCSGDLSTCFWWTLVVHELSSLFPDSCFSSVCFGITRNRGGGRSSVIHFITPSQYYNLLYILYTLGLYDD